MDYYIISPPKGQAHKIANYIHKGLSARGESAFCLDYTDTERLQMVPCRACCIALSPVYYGQHLKDVTGQVRSICRKNPLLYVALLSVSLSARSLKVRHKSPQLDQWKEECSVDTILCEAIAGRLTPMTFPWPMRPFVRLWFRFVLKRSDGSQFVELTDWRQVDAIIETIVYRANIKAEFEFRESVA